MGLVFFLGGVGIERQIKMQFDSTNVTNKNKYFKATIKNVLIYKN